MTTKDKKKPSTFVVVSVIVGVAGIATGVIATKGITAEVIPVIIAAAMLFGIVWIGGFQIGAAFADWLEKKWYR